MLLLRLLTVGLALGSAACSFHVERPIPEQRVRGSVTSLVLTTLFVEPLAMDIDIEQETKAQGTGPARHAYLEAMSFAVTPTAIAGASDRDDLDFLSSVTVEIASARKDSQLPRAVLATLDPVPRGAVAVELVPSELDLLPYVQEGAEIHAKVRGAAPSDDVSFDGSYSVRIEL